MTRRLAMMFLTTMLLFGVVSCPVWADNSDVVSLKGISGLMVLAWDIDEACKALGLTKETIQSDVESKLRLAGMGVLPINQGVEQHGTPSLYIKVAANDHNSAAIVTVQLRQNVLLERNRVLLILIPTWDRTSVITNPSAQRVRNAVKDSVDIFLNAWLSVNPKK